MVEKFPVAFLGGQHLKLKFVALRPPGLDLLQGHVLRLTNFLEHQHDHAHGEHQLEARGDEQRQARQILRIFQERIGPHVRAPQEKTERQQGGPDIRMGPAVFEKTARRHPTGNRDEREHGDFDFQGLGQMTHAHVTPHQKKQHEQPEHGGAHRLAQKTQAPHSKKRAETPMHHCSRMSSKGPLTGLSTPKLSVEPKRL